MLLEPTPELEIPPKRGKTLIVSVAVHALLIAFLIFEPGLFDSYSKRTIRIEGNDYDVKQLTELELQPAPRPAPKVDDGKPLPEPPKTVQPSPPPPPPPPPPPQHVITPDDILAEGAKPDGKAQASRGAAPEPQQQGGAPADSPAQTARTNPLPAPAPSNPQRGNPPPPQIAQNTNPNAPTVPNLLQQALKNTDQSIRAAQRAGSGAGATMGAKTGRADAPNGQNFSADGSIQILSDTKGYDFGSYLNQVLNRIRSNWLIPESARFGAKGYVYIDFTIVKNGDIFECRIVRDSGRRELDGAAKGAIDSSNPFQKLPSGFTGDELALRIGFFYNMPVQ